jgi:hypothetical protein
VELAAVRSDLELLQRLCVSETTIARWIDSVASQGPAGGGARKQPDGWIAAAGELGALGRPAVVNEGGEGNCVVGEDEDGMPAIDCPTNARAIGRDSVAVEGVAAAELEARTAATCGKHTSRPASAAERAKLRDAIAQSWRWADALPTLMRHWRDVGAGDVGAVVALAHDAKTGLHDPDAAAARGGAFAFASIASAAADDDDDAPAIASLRGDAWRSTPRTRQHAAARGEVVEALRRFVESETGGAAHVLVHGAPGVGKRWLLRSAIASQVDDGLRVVSVPREGIRTLPTLCDEMRSRPRTKFAVLLEMPLALTPFAEFHNELTSVLDGGGGPRGWPANAMLCATALRESGLKPGSDEVGASLETRFPTRVALE